MTATLTTAAAPPFDEAKSQAFVDEHLRMLNASARALMTSIGHRTGLFDALDGLDWATSGEVAAASRLDERYVREWLGGMVVARVIDYRPADRTYRLPPEHARWLTSRATPENLAVSAQWIAELGHVESQVVEKFRTGGGVHYHCYHRFHEVMAEESGQTVVAALEDHILPLEPALRGRLERGIDVLEIGCGSGWALTRLAMLFPNSTFTGYDLCEDAIERANEAAIRSGATNLRFAARDVTGLKDDAAFDLVLAFDVIHDQKAPARVLANVHRALPPDGTFLMQDISASSQLEKNIDHPLGAFLYTISTMHCMTVSLAQDGEGLGTCWGEELAHEMLRDAGFSCVTMHKLPHDFMNSYYVVQR